MAGLYFEATGLPLDGARKALAGNEAIGPALPKKQEDGLAVFVGHKGDVIALKLIVDSSAGLVGFT